MMTNCTASPPIKTPTTINIKHHKPSSPTPPPSSSQPNNSSSSSLTFKSNILLSTYLKTKTLPQSLQLFHLLPSKDTITYNTIISACSTQHHFTTSLHLFFQMITSGLHQPDILTFRSILKVCVETGNHSLGMQVHAYIVKLFGLASLDLIASTHLINLYGEFGMVEFACNVFDEIPLKDLVAFSSMMGCYNRAGMFNKVLKMFRMLLENNGLIPNEFVFTSALSASASSFSLPIGEQIHAYIIKSSLGSDVFVGTALINMYVKCNETHSAEKAFSGIDTPNVVAWNAVMAGKISGKQVLRLFEKMWRESELGVSPDHVTFGTVLRACGDIDLFSVSQIHGLITKFIGVEVDVFIGGALFTIYLNNGLLSNAARVLNDISRKDITAFNLAIHSYRQKECKEEAVTLFYEALGMGMEPNEDTLTSLMIKIGDLNEGKQLHALATKLGFSGSNESDVPIASSLVIMYAAFQRLDDAIHLFYQIHYPDLVLWTAMISSFSLSGECQEALELYILLLSKDLGEPPNHYTFSTVLHSCASLAAAEEGRQIHAQIIKSGLSITSDIFVTNGLVDMYAKSGYVTEAKFIFDEMSERDLPLWNSMISGLAQHGYAETAIEVFHELLNESNIEPNHITFVGVLSACSHGGLVEEGYRYFKLIKDPTIEHYTCLIDLLGRAGHLEDALNLIEEMPFDPNEIIWSSLLSSSTIHCNILVGEYAANNLFQLNTNDPGTYIALSNIYAAAGRWEDVKKIRKLMNSRGVKKIQGRSWLTVNGMVHAFVAEDKHQVHPC